MASLLARAAAAVSGGRLENGLVRVEGLVLQPSRALLLSLAEIAAGVGLLAASTRASFTLPGVPVPFTLQTLALTLIITLLGPRAWRTVAAYITAGLLGAPVFAMGGGPGYTASPSFGYILGFLLAAAIAGRLSRPATRQGLLRGALLVLPLVYLPGALWLAAWLAAVKELAAIEALKTALWSGILVFIPWDVFKAAIAAQASHQLLKHLYLYRVRQ